MAVSSRTIRVIEIVNNLPQYKNYDSKNLELLLKGVAVSSDGGVTVIEMTESGGNFAFGSKKLTGLSQGTASGDAVALNGSSLIPSALLPDLSGTYIATSQKGANSGVASLDSGGKVPFSQLPASLMEFQGTWNATTNTPALHDSTGGLLPSGAQSGWFYRVQVAGTQNLGGGAQTFAVGDWVMFNGSAWQLAHAGSDAVISVNSYAGVVVLGTDDIAEGSTNKYYHSATARGDIIASSISSGDTTHAPNGASVYTALGGKVSTTVTVNGHALSSNVSVTSTDVGLGNVDNVQQLPMSYLDTDAALAANSDAKVASQKATKAYADTKVPTSRAVNGHALSGDVTVTKSDVSLGSVDNVQQLPMSYLDTDGALAANDNVHVPTDAAVRTYVAAQLAGTSYLPYTNKDGSSQTVGQVAFFDGASGGMRLAVATSPSILATSYFGMVKDASIASNASGNFYLPKKGTVVGGFSGLTVGSPLYVSRSSAGSYVSDLTSFTTGDHVIFIGWAVSATQVLWVGDYQYQLG